MHNESNRTACGERKLMLDARREKLFHFDLDDVLATLGNHEAAGSLKGNITIKAAVFGVDKTKEYLDRIVTQKVITTDERHRIVELLNRYSTWR